MSVTFVGIYDNNCLGTIAEAFPVLRTLRQSLFRNNNNGNCFEGATNGCTDFQRGDAVLPALRCMLDFWA